MFDRERPERASEVAAERRRRDGSSVGHRLKLDVPEAVREKLAAEGRTPRWVNDVHNRIADLTERDDYDRVEGVEPVKVGTGEDNQPVFAYLLAKRSDFIAEDRSKLDQRRRETEAGMLKGKIPVSGSEAQPMQGQMGAPTYVDPASKIGRANQVLE
jgi:hypothetical protein